MSDTAGTHHLPFTYALGVTDLHRELWHEGDDAAIFPLASVSKPIAALAVLVAVERGMLSLEDSAGPEGATVRHLLAHTAGYAFDSADVLAEPGARRIYSNANFDALAEAVELATGYEMSEWVELTVVDPLGLTDLEVSGSPAKDYRGSVRDLLAVGRAWLAPGFLREETWREATRVQFPDTAGVLPGYGRQKPNPWGLGVEIRGRKQPHWTGERSDPATFGHFGQSGSFLWMDPQRKVAAAFLGTQPFGPEHVQIWPGLTDAILERVDRERGAGVQ